MGRDVWSLLPTFWASRVNLKAGSGPQSLAHLSLNSFMDGGPTASQLTKPCMLCRLSFAEEGDVFLLSRAKPEHKRTPYKQRQVLNSLNNLLHVICPDLLINVCEALGGLNALQPLFT